ncbi:MAG TPA: helix-turn-helix transcriptional regulator [Pseudonocardiaceae bacterium]|jgi:DNA-binding Xre family transcriptional regulator
MKWNLRLTAANRGIWKASDLHRMLAEHGLAISAGKMSGLWSGQPASIKLDDLDVICTVLGCQIGEVLIPEPGQGHPAHQRRGTRGRGRWNTGGDAKAPRRQVPAPTVTTRLAVLGTVRSCASCLAWGRLVGHGLCVACTMFARDHAVGECTGCGRGQPVRKRRAPAHRQSRAPLASRPPSPAVLRQHALHAWRGHDTPAPL